MPVIIFLSHSTHNDATVAELCVRRWKAMMCRSGPIPSASAPGSDPTSVLAIKAFEARTL
jgi:hypothetical protein